MATHTHRETCIVEENDKSFTQRDGPDLTLTSSLAAPELSFAQYASSVVVPPVVEQRRSKAADYVRVAHSLSEVVRASATRRTCTSNWIFRPSN